MGHWVRTMTSPAPKRPRGRQTLPDDERRVLVRTRLLPGSLAAVRAICERTGAAEARAVATLVDEALKARGE